MKKFAVCLCFGGSPPACSDYQVYKFSTAEELNAFLKGVDVAIGWLEAFQIDPGDECPICNYVHTEEKDVAAGAIAMAANE